MNLRVNAQTQQKIEQMVATGRFATPEEAVEHCVGVVKIPEIQQETAPANTTTVFDQLSQLGMIGCAGGGPKDLATNPIHMEDFGR